MSLFRKAVHRIFYPAADLSNSLQRFIVVFSTAAILCAICHFWFIIAFSLAGVEVLSGVNFVSVAIWVYLLLFGFKYLLLSLYLAVGGILAHAALAVIFVGWDAYFTLFTFGLTLVIFLAPKSYGGHKLGLYLIVCATYYGLYYLHHHATPMATLSSFWLSFFVIQNSTILIVAIALMGGYYLYQTHAMEDALYAEYARTERILRNILPDHVASRLKTGPQLIADGIPNAQIMFADLVGFTEFAEHTDPQRLVELLNEFFSDLDELTDDYELEKIKTIGDSYMVAGGLLADPLVSSVALARLGLDMLHELHVFNQRHQLGWGLRIGIHAGPVVAGVIGKKKLTYDLWGDTVNVASRLETTCKTNQIHVSEAFKQLVGHEFICGDPQLTNLQPTGYVPRLERTWHLLECRWQAVVKPDVAHPPKAS